MHNCLNQTLTKKCFFVVTHTKRSEMRRFVEIKFVVIVKAYRKAYRNNRSSFSADSNTQNKTLVNVIYNNVLRDQRSRKGR